MKPLRRRSQRCAREPSDARVAPRVVEAERGEWQGAVREAGRLGVQTGLTRSKPPKRALIVVGDDAARIAPMKFVWLVTGILGVAPLAHPQEPNGVPQSAVDRGKDPLSSALEVLGEIPSDARVVGYACSQDHAATAIAWQRGETWQVWSAGAKEPLGSGKGEAPSFLSLSPDGKRLAFVRPSEGGRELLVDGAVRATGAKFDSFVWSPDSQRFGFFVQASDGAAHVQIDDQRFGPYSKLPEGSLAYSPNGKRFSYVAKTDQGMVAFVDGVQEKHVFAQTGADAPIWNASSTQYAYGLRDFTEKRQRMIVVNDEQLGSFAEISRPAWDPTGRRLAFPFSRTKGLLTTFMIDGKEGPTFDGLGRFKLVFSPDGERHAYVARKGERRGLVVDGKLGTLYDHAIEPRFSPDGKRVACWVIHEGAPRLLLDGEIRPGFGDEAAYQAGIEIFSPNSQEVAYVVGEAGAFHVMRGTTKGPAYRSAAPHGARFDPTSQHVACVVLQGERWGLDVDGTFYPGFDRMWNAGQMAFHGDDSVTAIGLDGNKLVRLRVQLGGR